MDSSTAGWFSSSSPSSSSSSFFFFFFKRRVPTREKPSVTHTLQPSTGRIMSLTGIRLRVSVCLSICLSFTLPINKCHLPATPPFFPFPPPSGISGCVHPIRTDQRCSPPTTPPSSYSFQTWIRSSQTTAGYFPPLPPSLHSIVNILTNWP